MFLRFTLYNLNIATVTLNFTNNATSEFRWNKNIAARFLSLSALTYCTLLLLIPRSIADPTDVIDTRIARDR